MKNLSDCIKESINESSNKMTAIWSHEDPDTIYFIKNMSRDQYKRLRNTDWNWDDIDVKEPIAFCGHNDESIRITGVAASNLVGLKKLISKDIAQNIQEMIDAGEVYDEVIFYSLDEDEWSLKDFRDAKEVEDLKKINPDRAAEKWLKGLEDTEVDGDSSRAYYFVDLRKGEQIAGSEHISVVFADLEEDEDIRHSILGYDED